MTSTAGMSEAKYSRACPFTLIEVIIVVFIIALLLGMAMMRLDSIIPDARLKKQVRTTSDIIELAFSQAVIEGHELSLVLDAKEKKITLDYYAETDEDAEYLANFVRPKKDGEVDKNPKPLKAMTWDDSIELEEFEVLTQDTDGKREFMVFFPQGTCDGARMVWKEKSGITQEMSVWPLLGNVDIKPVNYDNVVHR